MHQTSRKGGEEQKRSSYQLSGAEIDASAASTVLLARHCSRGRGGHGVVLSSEKKPFSDFFSSILKELKTHPAQTKLWPSGSH